jgi:hypothetical protein
MYACTHAFGGDGARLLRGLGEALLLDDLDGLLFVAFGLAEGLLAVHHARARAITERLDLQR